MVTLTPPTHGASAGEAATRCYLACFFMSINITNRIRTNIRRKLRRGLRIEANDSLVGGMATPEKVVLGPVRGRLEYTPIGIIIRAASELLGKSNISIEEGDELVIRPGGRITIESEFNRGDVHG